MRENAPTRSTFRVLRAPQALPSAMYLGTGLVGYNSDYPICIDPEARARHLYVIGATGSGKTSLIENMIAQDLAAGEGLCFIDPHGDAAQRIAGLVPPERRDHLAFLDLDDGFPIGLNFLTGIPEADRPRAAANIVAAFIHIWGEASVGARSQQVLRNSVRALMDAQGSTLLCIPKLLTDARYRERILRTVKDPIVRSYWSDQYERYDDRKRDDVISPILNKLDAFLSYPSLRGVLGQTRNTINLRKIMDERRILIIDLKKGLIGDPALIFGALILSALTQTALSRADIAEKVREPFFVYCDEFQSYATDAISDALSELRKYRLSLILAHQFMHQVPEPVQKAILGNAAALISFRIGADDSPLIAKHFDMRNPAQLQNLANYQAYLRPLIAGMPGNSQLFSTPLPAQPNRYRAASLIKNSRTRFGKDRIAIEAKIAAFLSSKPSRPSSVSKRRSKR